MPNITPYPGFILVHPTEPRESVVLDSETKKQQDKIRQGLVIAVGAERVSEYGKVIMTPIKANDIIHYFSYEAGYDEARIQGKKYHLVKFEDVRAFERSNDGTN